MKVGDKVLILWAKGGYGGLDDGRLVGTLAEIVSVATGYPILYYLQLNKEVVNEYDPEYESILNYFESEIKMTKCCGLYFHRLSVFYA